MEEMKAQTVVQRFLQTEYESPEHRPMLCEDDATNQPNSQIKKGDVQHLTRKVM